MEPMEIAGIFFPLGSIWKYDNGFFFFNSLLTHFQMKAKILFVCLFLFLFLFFLQFLLAPFEIGPIGNLKKKPLAHFQMEPKGVIIFLVFPIGSIRNRVNVILKIFKKKHHGAFSECTIGECRLSANVAETCLYL